MIKSYAESIELNTDTILEMHQSYKKKYEVKSKIESIWKPLVLKFKNMFVYGNDSMTTVKFKKGITSISGPNKSGKTSLVDVLLFSIFGKIPLNSSDFINKGSDEAYTSILLRLGRDYVLIERTLKKGKHLCSVWDSTIRSDKIKKMSVSSYKELIGDIKDFMLCNLLNRESSLDILSMLPSAQLTLFKKLFRLDRFDKYRKENKALIIPLQKELDQVEGELKAYEKLIDKYRGTRDKIEELEKTIEAISEEGRDTGRKSDVIKRDLQEFERCTMTLIEIVDEIEMIGPISEEKDPGIRLIGKVKDLIKEKGELLKRNVVPNQQDYRDIERRVKRYTENPYSYRSDLYTTLDDMVIYQQLDKLKKEKNADVPVIIDTASYVKELEECPLIEQDIVESYDLPTDREYCIVQESMVNKLASHLKNQGKRVKIIKRQNEVCSKIAVLEERIKKHELALENRKKIEDEVKVELERLNLIMDGARLSHINSMLLSRYHELRKLRSLYKKKSQLEEDYKDQLKWEKYRKRVDLYNKELFKARNDLGNLESLEKDKASLEEKIASIRCKIRPLLDYDTVISSKELISKIIYEQYLKALEEKVNQIISEYIDFRMVIEYDGNIDISMRSEDGFTISPSRLCGYEKLILQISTKLVLNELSYNSSSTILIIDESFDCIDEYNFKEKLGLLFDHIKKNYGLCLVISQRDISKFCNVIETEKLKDNSLN